MSYRFNPEKAANKCIEAGRQQYVYADHCRNDHDHPFIRRQ